MNFYINVSVFLSFLGGPMDHPGGPMSMGDFGGIPGEPPFIGGPGPHPGGGPPDQIGIGPGAGPRGGPGSPEFLNSAGGFNEPSQMQNEGLVW